MPAADATDARSASMKMTSRQKAPRLIIKATRLARVCTRVSVRACVLAAAVAVATTVDEKSPRVGSVMELARDANDGETKRRDRTFRGAFKRQSASVITSIAMRVMKVLKDAKSGKWIREAINKDTLNFTRRI